MNSFVKILIIYTLGAPLSLLLFILGFKVGLFSSDPIIFYRGLKILLLTSFIQWLGLTLVIVYLFKKKISVANAFASTMAGLALCATFLIVVPVSLDRSVSVFLLGYMNNIGRPMTSDELENVLISKYVKEYQSIDRRMDEQIASGNIVEIDDGKYLLTTRGKNFIFVSKKIAKYFSVDERFLDPQGAR
jgi:hypothetical protein